jgi:hypothetical protein
MSITRLALPLSAALLTACFTKRVETMSPPTIVRLRFEAICSQATVVEQHDGAGRYHKVVLENSTAVINIPGMTGGYSERAGHRSDVSDPNQYSVLRLRDDVRILLELSLDQISKLPTDADGRSIVPVRCASD